MSATNKGGLSRYKHIRHNGVTYYLIPQANRGTYALKTADGKLAGGSALIDARTFSSAVSTAKKIIRELEAEANRMQAVNPANAEAITMEEYISSSKELAIIDSNKDLVAVNPPAEQTPSVDVEDSEDVIAGNYQVRPTFRSLLRTAFARRPKVVSAGADYLNNALTEAGLSTMSEAISDMRRDNAKDMLLSGEAGQKLVGGLSKATSYLNRQHHGSVNKIKREKVTAIYNKRVERYKKAKESNKDAFTDYKQNLIAKDYEHLETLKTNIDSVLEQKKALAEELRESKTKLRKDKLSAQLKDAEKQLFALTTEKNEVTSKINEHMRKEEKDFPSFVPPYANLPARLPHKQDSLKERAFYAVRDAGFTAVGIDERRNLNKVYKQTKKYDKQRKAASLAASAA